jgi:hypothetical protein
MKQVRLVAALATLAGCNPSLHVGDFAGPNDLAPPPPDLAPAIDLAGDLMPPPPPPVHVVITADNAYAFGWGDANQVTHLLGRPTTQVASDIFSCPIGRGPEAYDVPADQAPVGAFLYIIAWCDDATTQGVIGQFLRVGDPVYTGDPGWQVCATGLYYDPANPPVGGGPTETVINTQIGVCTAGTGSSATTSAGWVDYNGAVTANAVGKLVRGEDNSSSTVGDFPIVCQMDTTKDMSVERGIDASAHWMWYDPPNYGSDPFRYTGGHNPTRAFLIFRLPTQLIP